jgi:hypothetical protein
MYPGWTLLLAPVLEAALVAGGECALLLAPQRRAPDPTRTGPVKVIPRAVRAELVEAGARSEPCASFDSQPERVGARQ